MSEQTSANGPGAIWRHQPEEKHAVKLEQITNRRMEELSFSTRSEILMSIGAALLFVAVTGWRFAHAFDRLQVFGFASVIAWVAISLYWFRHHIWPDRARPDVFAATGLDHYRKELERRRDHLRNAWLWHGPLFLASMVVISMWIGKAFPAFQRVRNVLPLVMLLAVWTAFGLSRRRRQANELQREIDEIEPRGTDQQRIRP